MRKKAMSLFLILCLVLTMMPTAIFAADESVAKIGETTYTTLQGAIDAVADEGDTILLLNDINLSETITNIDQGSLEISGGKVENTDSNGKAINIKRYASISIIKGSYPVTIKGTGVFLRYDP